MTEIVGSKFGYRSWPVVKLMTTMVDVQKFNFERDYDQWLKCKI